MLNGNQLERYGAVTKSLGVMSPNAKVFFVGATTLPNYQDFADEFPIDKQGGNRLFATIAAAVADSNVVASRGDIVYIMPGHTETISTSTALNLSKAGLVFRGLGTGILRPTITLDTANTATITVSANGITIENVIFIANFLAIAACFTLTTAKDFQTINCDFRDTSASLNFIAYFVLSATSNANDGLLLDGNRFYSAATSGAVKLVSFLGTLNRVTIQNNKYLALTTNAGAVMPIATGKAVTDFYFLNNFVNIQNAAGTGTGYLITADTAGSGFIHGNYLSALPTTPLLVTAGRGFVYGANYHTDQADTSGYLLPVADA